MTVRLNHIKVTGLGLTDDFLLELADRAQTARIKNATAASYSVEPNSLEEAVQDAWDSARKLWAKVPLSSQTGTAQPGWENFVRPLLTRMGYTASFVRPQASALTAAQQRFPISYLSETGDVPVHFSHCRAAGQRDRRERRADQPPRPDAGLPERHPGTPVGTGDQRQDRAPAARSRAGHAARLPGILAGRDHGGRGQPAPSGCCGCCCTARG